MDNKRGWMRIVEASIAIIIVLTFLFFTFQRGASADYTDLSVLARQVLEEAAYNDQLREDIVLGTPESQEALDSFVRSRIRQSSISFEARICETGDVCGKSEYVGDNVYAAEYIFSAAVVNVETIRPKKVRLFLWRTL